MTLNEIAYNILNIVRGGRSNNDDHISLSQVKFNIKHYRAMMIRRDLARNNFMSRHIEQDLKCLRLIPVDASRCCGEYNLNIVPSEGLSMQQAEMTDKIFDKLSKEYTAMQEEGATEGQLNAFIQENYQYAGRLKPTFDGTNCIIARTEMTIPRSVRANFKELITFVGAVDGFERIPLVDVNRIQYLPYDKYTKDTKKAFFIEDYLYVFNPGGMELVNVRGVFEDPEALKYYDCNGSNCYDDNHLFPMPADMTEAITQGLISGSMMMLANPAMNDTELDRMQDPPTQ